MWDILKHINICILGVPEGEDSEKATEKNIKRYNSWKLQNLLKRINFHIHGAQLILSRIRA